MSYDDDDYRDTDKALDSKEALVQPSRFNVLTQREWQPPKQVERRLGSFTFKTWPSKGGD